ncbi:response regulator transcription factor [Lentilactobacillus sp. SPB1-3]|uniref:Response regulator transcription factor n=1 Tax=Lentilactobacillus terminaliae TaxID=3003483 RepID=A0ACD5DGC2_9LACO|nr:response regulator transcription factor [Lentilactobacillus sp. SPB1-3]MCZ0976826.1 response regulator transcription factor [Lentilactobacillus sp. SPB1-3]
MSKTILLVDDEPSITDINGKYLERAGYVVHISANGIEALEWLKNHSADLIATDIMMPEMDGYDMINEIIDKNPDQPFLFFTAKTSDQDKIYSLTLGADDFISKPFSPRELVLRITNILKRVNGSQHNSIDEDIIVGDLTINHQTRDVKIAGKHLTLTAKEFEILWILAQNPERVYSKSELYDMVWQEDFVDDANTLNVHIHNIRNELSKNGTDNTPILKTVWSVGYKLEGQET